MQSALSPEIESKNACPEANFDPGEIAILRAYFDLPPAPGLPALSELYEPEDDEAYKPERFPDPDDEPRNFPSVPIRLRHLHQSELSDELSNAVARICLGEVQDRLPQYWSPDDEPSRLRFPTPDRTLRPLNPQRLLKIIWASSPGFDWPEVYFVTRIPGFDRYVVAVSVDDAGDWEAPRDLALGWFDSSEGVVDGSRRILLDCWRTHGDPDGSGWTEVSPGLIDHEDAERMRLLVWPHSDDDESARLARRAPAPLQTRRSCRMPFKKNTLLPRRPQ